MGIGILENHDNNFPHAFSTGKISHQKTGGLWPRWRWMFGLRTACYCFICENFHDNPNDCRSMARFTNQ